MRSQKTTTNIQQSSNDFDHHPQSDPEEILTRRDSTSSITHKKSATVAFSDNVIIDNNQQHQKLNDYSAQQNNNNNTDSDADADNNNNNNNNNKFANLNLNDGTSNASAESDNSLEDSGADSMISGSSMSSSASKSLKSTIPFGISQPVLMTLVICVPIIWLVVLTMIPLAQSVASDDFVQDHVAVLRGIRSSTYYNLYERVNSSLYLEYALEDRNHPTLGQFRRDIATSRKSFDNEMMKIEEQMRESDLDHQKEFTQRFNAIRRDIERERQKVDSLDVRVSQYRRTQVVLINRMTRLILFIGQDSRGQVLETHIKTYALVRRVATALSSILDSGTGIIRAGNNTQRYINSLIAVESNYEQIQADLQFLADAADPVTAAELDQFQTTPATVQFRHVVSLLISQNSTLFANLTEDNLTSVYHSVYSELMSVDARALEKVVNGEILKAIEVKNALLMGFAVACCIVALGIAIHYNRKEQSRLERALDSTAVLASAVQRFVPKNQLKTMGVRSITQVQPGMTTEVAQTITFSDIREFTRLSESMTRLELFDWLQNYVSRMTQVVSEEKSYIFAFLGDGLGICSPQPTHAVNAAIKMHVAVDGLNLDLIAKGGRRPIKIGVGIHHGIVVAGVFGNNQRLSVSMIAPDVNFASRLEALTKSFGVKTLISESVVDHISSELFAFRHVGQVQVKGSSVLVKVYDLYQADTLPAKEFKEETRKEFEAGVALFDSGEAEKLSEAGKQFDGLCMRAKLAGVTDSCSEMYRRKISHGAASGFAASGVSVLSFEKDGEFKQQGCENLGESSSPTGLQQSPLRLMKSNSRHHTINNSFTGDSIASPSSFHVHAASNNTSAASTGKPQQQQRQDHYFSPHHGEVVSSLRDEDDFPSTTQQNHPHQVQDNTSPSRPLSVETSNAATVHTSPHQQLHHQQQTVRSDSSVLTATKVTNHHPRSSSRRRRNMYQSEEDYEGSS